MRDPNLTEKYGVPYYKLITTLKQRKVPQTAPCWVSRWEASGSKACPALFLGFIVEARKLEHHYPHALKVKL